MLIRLVPRPPLPTVLFTLAFPNPPQDLPLPINFAHQLQRLVTDELDMPGNCGLYALDKSAWLVALLREITFDMNLFIVRCVFVDGAVEEWPIADAALLRELEQVAADVTQSTIESEREKRKMMLSAASPPPPPPSPIPVPVAAPVRPRHKRQRSLLMTIVSSLLPSSRPASPRPSQVVELPPPSPLPVIAAPEPDPMLPISPHSSRALRRRARSTLVDAYNKFILSELRQRVKHRGGHGFYSTCYTPFGGYAMWAAHSMLRRTEAHMQHLMSEAGGMPELAESLRKLALASEDRTPRARESCPVTGDACSEETFFEDEDGEKNKDAGDGSSLSTEDSASIRTPGDTISLDRPLSVPRTPSPPGLTARDLELFGNLQSHAERLRGLIQRMEGARETREHEYRQLLAVLEVKSRRRAWSSKRLMVLGSADRRERELRGASSRDCGLAEPVRRSPLGWYPPFSADDMDMSVLALTRSPPSARRRSLKIASAPHDLSELFPVEEEEPSMAPGPIEEEPLIPDCDAARAAFVLEDSSVDRDTPVPPGIEQQLQSLQLQSPSAPLSSIPPVPAARAIPRMTALSPAPRHKHPLPRRVSPSALPLLCQPLAPAPLVSAPFANAEFKFSAGHPNEDDVDGKHQIEHSEWSTGIAAR